MKKQNITVGLTIQFILLIILIILMILSIFFKICLPIADFIAGLTFMIIAYNKRKENSKFMLIIFILFGILFMSLGVYNIING